MYLKSGSVKYYIDFKEYDLCAGDIVFVFPETIHSHEASEPDTENFILILPRDVPFLKDVFQKMVPVCPVLKGAATEELDSLFNEALKASTAQSEYSQSIALGYAQIFVSKLLSITELRESKQMPSSLERKLIEYCTAHFNEPLTLNSVAAHFGYSPTYLSHVFTQKFKMGFAKFLNTLRIEEAKKMLRGNESITEIAYDCGYSGIRNFNRVFKETVGKTPKEYRESKKK